MFPPFCWRGRIGGVLRHPPIRLVSSRCDSCYFLIFGLRLCWQLRFIWLLPPLLWPEAPRGVTIHCYFLFTLGLRRAGCYLLLLILGLRLLLRLRSMAFLLPSRV